MDLEGIRQEEHGNNGCKYPFYGCVLTDNSNLRSGYLKEFFFSFCKSDVHFFSNSLDKYNSEHEQAVSILEHRPIGMILVDCKKLKEVLIPSPLKCLEVSVVQICSITHLPGYFISWVWRFFVSGFTTNNY